MTSFADVQYCIYADTLGGSEEVKNYADVIYKGSLNCFINDQKMQNWFGQSSFIGGPKVFLIFPFYCLSTQFLNASYVIANLSTQKNFFMQAGRIVFTKSPFLQIKIVTFMSKRPP